MPPHNPQAEPGLFIETTSIFDVQSIYNIDINSEQFKEFLVNLKQTVNNIALALNLKDSGLYPQQEFVCGQIYFPNPNLSSTTPQKPTWRQVFRKIFLWPRNLPNTAIDTIPHGITLTPDITFTRIYGCASSPAFNSYIPLPFVSSGGNIAELVAHNNDIVISTNANFNAYNITYVILEFLKD